MRAQQRGHGTGAGGAGRRSPDGARTAAPRAEEGTAPITWCRQTSWAARWFRREARARGLRDRNGGEMSGSSRKVGKGRVQARKAYSPAEGTNRAPNQEQEGRGQGQLKGRKGNVQMKAASNTDSCQ